jgi:hypothetical protein
MARPCLEPRRRSTTNARMTREVPVVPGRGGRRGVRDRFAHREPNKDRREKSPAHRTPASRRGSTSGAYGSAAVSLALGQSSGVRRTAAARQSLRGRAGRRFGAGLEGGPQPGEQVPIAEGLPERRERRLAGAMARREILHLERARLVRPPPILFVPAPPITAPRSRTDRQGRLCVAIALSLGVVGALACSSAPTNYGAVCAANSDRTGSAFRRLRLPMSRLRTWS